LSTAISYDFIACRQKEPGLIYPTLHYQNGGVKIDVDGESDVRNLFVAGEASGGLHGRNRLMGNSLLEIIVYGRRAGRAGRRGQAASVSGRGRFGIWPPSPPPAPPPH